MSRVIMTSVSYRIQIASGLSENHHFFYIFSQALQVSESKPANRKITQTGYPVHAI